jgi:hypothetical protein
MKPMYQPYDNGIIPSNRAFNADMMERCVEGILRDAKMERYDELNETRDWLERCKKYTETTIANYDKGIDSTGALFPDSKGSYRYVNETTHHKRKLERINIALAVCKQNMPFSD